ncbi:hypothetical protein LJR153_004633 [Paenibacillus sp. LjRoot153]|uniref:hypothetical protein n=1 Tax=Paenibacillus sp. LjRoot153 TaxID=3342270 RepID=UPI003ED0E811
MKFLEAGMSAIVLTYTTRMRPSMQPVQKQPIRDLSRAMIIISLAEFGRMTANNLQ